MEWVSEFTTWVVKAWDAMIEWLSRPIQFTVFTAVLWMALGALLVMTIARIGGNAEEDEGDER